jgi:cytoskeletal protein RodZ
MPIFLCDDCKYDWRGCHNPKRPNVTVEEGCSDYVSRTPPRRRKSSGKRRKSVASSKVEQRRKKIVILSIAIVAIVAIAVVLWFVFS